MAALLFGCTSILGDFSSGPAPIADATPDVTTMVYGDAGADVVSKKDGSKSDATHPSDAHVADAGHDHAAPLPDAVTFGDAPPGDSGTCNPSEVPNSGAAVFVSTASGAPSDCGTAATPCTTIAEALSLIGVSVGAKTIVYLDQGTYTESVTLLPGVLVQGGWKDQGGTWTRDCGATAAQDAVIQAASNITVTASYSGASTLDTLSLTSKSAPDAGQPLYGVFATGRETSLTLHDVVITVGQAGSGATGAAGDSGTTSSAGCSPAGDGGPGAEGGPGPGALATTYSPSGCTPAAGGPSTAGQPGQNGTAAPDGSCAFVSTCQITQDCPGPCEDTCCGSAYECVGAGSNGCGGGGASAAGGGGGGGCDIAVFDWGAIVTIAGSSLTTGKGGNGGNGGAAGPGGAGTKGQTGTGAPAYVDCYSYQVPVSEGGAPGGPGGNGGPSGRGGGGAGGDSYCYYQGGDGGKVMAAASSCAHGAAGVGGNAGLANQGAAGNTAIHN